MHAHITTQDREALLAANAERFYGMDA